MSKQNRRYRIPTANWKEADNTSELIFGSGIGPISPSEDKAAANTDSDNFGALSVVCLGWGIKSLKELAQNLTQSKGAEMANSFVHVELNTTDVSKAKAFYAKLFDWKLEDVPMGDTDYTIIKVGQGTGGGIMKHPMAGAPSTWLAYVLVDDISAATQKARSLGATVIKDVTEVTGMGWLSIIVDPTGAALGLWKPKMA